MSLEVKCFDEKGVEVELAKCPQIVQDYVKQLKGSRDNWKNICADAVNKLRKASKNNGVLHGVMVSVCSCTRGKGTDHDETGREYCIDCGGFV